MEINAQMSIGILSGGKSTRMGQDKGRLIINGVSFVENLAQKFINNYPVYLSVGYGAEDKYKIPNVTIIEDEIKDCGPLGGIAA